MAGAAVIAWMMLAGPTLAEGEDADALVAQIKKVGREGAGNAEAAKAWKKLVAKGPAALVPILAKMDETNLTTQNWLRPAVDAICEKALRDKAGLPKADLEKFIGKTSNPPGARRLAYEWLVQVDKKTPERLLPGMIQDPSPELRRDAVARVVKAADSVFEKKENETAIDLYRKALKGACDQDQVDHIAKKLKALKVEVDLASHFGVVKQWHLVGPFDNRKGVGFKEAYFPEKKVSLAATYKDRDGKDAKWVEQKTADPYGKVDLNKALGKQKGAVAYAFAVIDSPKAQPVEVRAGAITAIKIFLNGKEIFGREEYHHGSQFDQYSAKGKLKEGRNELLIKCCQNEQKEPWAQDWNFQVRLCDSVGAAIPWKPAKAVKLEAKP
jgi:hypothetical protein